MADSIAMELLTPRAAARQLGVSYPTLKQWIYRGTVRTRQTAGGHHRIPATEIDRLLAASGRGLRKTPKRSAQSRLRRAAAGQIVTLSGRNQLRGIVEEVRVEGLLAQVRLRVGDQSLTAIITRDAVDELRLRRGDEALAVIKATEVMVAR
jgi:molybdopterin-binding protein